MNCDKTIISFFSSIKFTLILLIFSSSYFAYSQPGSIPVSVKNFPLKIEAKEINSPSIFLINIIPQSASGDLYPDPEPSISVNTKNTDQLVIAALSWNSIVAPNDNDRAPLFYSDDGGSSWAAIPVLPASSIYHPDTRVIDPELVFSNSTDFIYAAYLNFISCPTSSCTYQLEIARNNFGSVISNIPFTLFSQMQDIDFPRVAVATEFAPIVMKSLKGTYFPAFFSDHLITEYVHKNNSNKSAAMISPKANLTTPTFSETIIERSLTTIDSKDGSITAVAAHDDGTVYVILSRWNAFSTTSASSDLVIYKNDNYGTGEFDKLVGVDGQIIKSGISVTRGMLANNRSEGHLAIAVNPNNSQELYIVYSSDSDFKLHLITSIDGGQSWSGDLLTVTRSINPSIAIDNYGRIGFLYQKNIPAIEFDGTLSLPSFLIPARWETHFQSSTDGTGWSDYKLNKFSYDISAFSYTNQEQPFLGDYTSLRAEENTFYGTFAASNEPDDNNFPFGRPVYQRLCNWTNHKLLDAEGNEVGLSIDPFFFKASFFDYNLLRSDCTAVEMKGVFDYCKVCNFCCGKAIVKNPFVYFTCPHHEKPDKACFSKIKLLDLLKEFEISPPDPVSNDYAYCNLILKKFNFNEWEIKLYDENNNAIQFIAERSAKGSVLSFKYNEKRPSADVIFYFSPLKRDTDKSSRVFETKIKFSPTPIKQVDE